MNTPRKIGKNVLCKIGLVVGGLLLSSYASAAETTLQGAAQKAIATNPEVQAAWHQFLASGDEYRSAKGAYLPQVDLGASGGVERHKIDEIDETDHYDPVGVNLTVTQLLFDGWATSTNVERLSKVRRARYFDLLNAAESASLEAVRAYEDVRRYQELVKLAEGNLSRHRETLARIRDRVAAGVSRSVDGEQATGRLALAESNLVIEQSNLHDVSARYQRVVGEWPAAELQPATLSNLTLPGDVVGALNGAYETNPALASASEQIRAANEQYENRKSLYYPRVDLRLRGEYGDDIDRIKDNTSDLRAEVLMNYNLFAGGSHKALISAASNLIDVAKDNLETTCRDVRQTLRIAYNDHQRIGTQLEFLKVHADSTAKARAAYLDQFQIGQRTLLDLLDTENEWFESQRAYTNGNYDYSIASARTLAGMGDLRKSLGIARADEPTLDSLGGKDESQARCPAETEAPPVAKIPQKTDGDGDGVDDLNDLCPGTPPGTPVDAAGCAYKQVVVLKDVNFAFNSTVLTEDSKTILDNASRILRANPAVKVEIAGHTDNVGSPEYNIKLSQGRAASVVNYLASTGVATDRMTPKGYGLTQPKATNETKEGRAINRRTELRVIQNAAPLSGSAPSAAPMAPSAPATTPVAPKPVAAPAAATPKAVAPAAPKAPAAPAASKPAPAASPAAPPAPKK
jgi:adhesin transport system outer membrane protein